MDRLDSSRTTDSTETDWNEKRLHPRFAIPRCHVFSNGEKVHLLNLGRSGMAIESLGRCNFSRSEDHRFVLDDEVNSIEVIGNVSWVSSFWLDDAQVPGTGLVQTVGVSFQEVVSPYRVGLWRGIEPIVLSQGSTDHDLVPLAESPAMVARPSATMTRPRDGSTIASRFITVEGHLRDPETVARMTVNGIEASLEGSKFRARVHLTRDVNYLCAVVSHWNTIDSTCFLGKILRALDEDGSRTEAQELSPMDAELDRASHDVLVLPALPEDDQLDRDSE